MTAEVECVSAVPEVQEFASHPLASVLGIPIVLIADAFVACVWHVVEAHATVIAGGLQSCKCNNPRFHQKPVYHFTKLERQ